MLFTRLHWFCRTGCWHNKYREMTEWLSSSMLVFFNILYHRQSVCKAFQAKSMTMNMTNICGIWHIHLQLFVTNWVWEFWTPIWWFSDPRMFLCRTLPIVCFGESRPSTYFALTVMLAENYRTTFHTKCLQKVWCSKSTIFSQCCNVKIQ